MKKAVIFIGLLLIVCAAFAQTVNIRGSKMILQYGADNYSVELKGDSVLIDASDFIWFADKFGSDTLLFGDGTFMTTAFVSGVNDTGYVKTTGDTLWGTFNFEGTDSYIANNDLFFYDDIDTYVNLDYDELIVADGNNGIVLKASKGITINGLVNSALNDSNFDDDESIILPNTISGWGEVYAFNYGAIDEWAEFIISSDGAVYLKSNSTDVVNTDTDNKLCIFDNGSGVTIRNRLGGQRTVKYIIHH